MIGDTARPGVDVIEILFLLRWFPWNPIATSSTCMMIGELISPPHRSR